MFQLICHCLYFEKTLLFRNYQALNWKRNVESNLPEIMLDFSCIAIIWHWAWRLTFKATCPKLYFEKNRGVARPLQTKNLKRSDYYNSKYLRYFWYKFFDVKFFIFENAIRQMPLPLIYRTSTSFFWSTKYMQRKINTC